MVKCFSGEIIVNILIFRFLFSEGIRIFKIGTYGCPAVQSKELAYSLFFFNNLKN